jgi:hypothetical protein
MEHKIINTFQEHKRSYGARRIAKSLQALSEPVSRYKASKVLGASAGVIAKVTGLSEILFPALRQYFFVNGNSKLDLI